MTQLDGLKLIDLKFEHIPEILVFADEYIGPRYYDESSLKEILSLSKNGLPSTCLGLLDESSGKIVALRISFPPGTWMEHYCEGTLKENWGFPENEVGYFKSLFLAPKFRGRGLGPFLSETATDRMKAHGAKAILVHSWKESPHNASLRYLTKMGFNVVGEHPLYWNKVDYDCAGCKVFPCTCTAVEMILEIDKPKPQR